MVTDFYTTPQKSWLFYRKNGNAVTVASGVFSNFPWYKFATISTALIATLFLPADDLFHATR